MASSTSSSGVPTKQTQRILRDLKATENDPLPFVSNLRHAINDKINEVTGVLIGPEDTPYAGGHFKFLIKYPPEYPFMPPEFYFSTPLLHPNVDITTGTACNDQLYATWAPSVTLSTVLTEMYALLKEPNYEVPIDGCRLVHTAETEEEIKNFTQAHARPERNE